MSAKIHARDGNWDQARGSLKAHKAAKSDPQVLELQADIEDGAAAAVQAMKEARAQLWTACYESSTRALRIALYSLPIRTMRAECALRAGDVESSVGDLSRLAQLRPNTQPSDHMTIFRLAYFFLPPPMSQTQNAALTALKQCLNLDPDSSVCLPAHRQLKSLEKSFVKAEALASKGDHRGVLDLLLGKDRANTGFLKTFEDALAKHTAPAPTSTSNSKSPQHNPAALPPTLSPRLTTILHLICSSHTALSLHKRGMPWCERLMAQDDQVLTDADWDAAAAGKAEGLMANEEWEEAVKVLESAWEKTRNEDVSPWISRLRNSQRLMRTLFRSNKDFLSRSAC